MKYSDLVDNVAEATGSTKVDAKKATDAIFAAIGDALVSGDEVAIKDFGTFKPKETAARTGRNPRTGEELKIPASKGAGFKMAKGLKDKLNG